MILLIFESRMPKLRNGWVLMSLQPVESLKSTTGSNPHEHEQTEGKKPVLIDNCEKMLRYDSNIDVKRTEQLGAILTSIQTQVCPICFLHKR